MVHFTDASHFVCRMFGVKTDEEAVKAPLATLNAKLDVYEKILGKQKYLAGDVSADHTSSLENQTGTDQLLYVVHLLAFFT